MASTRQLVAGPPPQSVEPARSSRARVQTAQVLALIALLTAAIGALGPAEPVRSTYAWPPPAMPTGAPSQAWYTPLLLMRHRPDAIAASLPCSRPPALPRAELPLSVLATARSPERIGGLAVRIRRQQLEVAVGESVLARAPLGGGGRDCTYRLRMADGRWSLAGGPDQRSFGGSLAAMPVVSGLFTAIDLGADAALSVEVTTAVHTSDTLLRQSIAWTLASLCALAALGLVAFDRFPRPGPGARRALTNA
ncbi:MAG: hypothetical protein ACRELC_06855, partial [Gemmatimonadota bacterium]